MGEQSSAREGIEKAITATVKNPRKAGFRLWIIYVDYFTIYRCFNTLFLYECCNMRQCDLRQKNIAPFSQSFRHDPMLHFS